MSGGQNPRARTVAGKAQSWQKTGFPSWCLESAFGCLAHNGLDHGFKVHFSLLNRVKGDLSWRCVNHAQSTLLHFTYGLTAAGRPIRPRPPPSARPTTNIGFSLLALQKGSDCLSAGFILQWCSNRCRCRPSSPGCSPIDAPTRGHSSHGPGPLKGACQTPLQNP